MSKKWLLVSLIFVVALGVAGCGKKQDKLTLTLGESRVNNENAIEKFTGSMKDLLARGEAVKCDFEVKNKEFTQKSQLYVDGKNMRTDYVMTASGQPEQKGHSLLTGDYMYVWMDDGKKTGTKMKVEETSGGESGGPDAGTGSAQAVDMDVKLEMDCAGWSGDNSVFTPPSDIKFTDLSAMLQNLDGGNMCGTCDMMSGQQKTDCQKALCK